jgi:hypothetical protein
MYLGATWHKTGSFGTAALMVVGYSINYRESMTKMGTKNMHGGDVKEFS